MVMASNKTEHNATYKINILSWKSKWQDCGWESSIEEMVGGMKASDNECVRFNHEVPSKTNK